MVKLTTRAFLKQLGLIITTPESDPRGYGYQWRDRQWVGPFGSEYQALQAAFNEAIEIMNSERPFAQVNGELWMWNNGWRYVGFQEPESESNQP
jgi:hypothetical protein